ncbi:Triacylglycerol lipase 1 [Thelohanellus kitauei]|uniref:Triacylglycerol lipase 1 n=1 Tax=Thelohanellus kitauei TaxID=669202 RepID=A0A0C2JDG2_THEKT|nr:Triacylglycerol lipase 1 [Thelohanellus kitauei]
MLSRFDVIGRAKLLGCEISKNQLITSDGYTLTLHHLHSKRLLNHSESRFPVLLVSGLLCDANIFFIPPPNRCLPYILSSLGYDVWIGNVRGTYYSGYKEQIVKKSKSHFWDFWFGFTDLVSMI